MSEKPFCDVAMELKEAAQQTEIIQNEHAFRLTRLPRQPAAASCEMVSSLK